MIREVPEWRPVGASKGLRNEDICLPSPQWYRRRKVMSKGHRKATYLSRHFSWKKIKVHLTNIINSPEDGHVDMMDMCLVSTVMFSHV